MQNAYTSHEDTLRNNIIDATVRCIGIKGIDKTRISDVANELGVARQTIYNYFANKNELFNEVFSHEAFLLAQKIAAHIEQFDDVEDQFTHAFLYAIEEFPKNLILSHVVTTGGQYLQEMGVSRQTMQSFGEVVLSEVFNDNPFLKARADDICELLSRNILSFLMVPDPDPRTSSEQEVYVRKCLLPGLGLK